MRNRIITVVFLLAFIMLLSPSLFAEETTPSATMRTQLMREKRDAMREERKEFQEEMKEKREEALEKFKLQRETFKEKLEVIKDEEKKEAVENVDEKINELNKKHVEHLEKNLATISAILDRIKDRAEDKKASGESTVEVDMAIASAETVIEAAQDALTSQAGKEYVITIQDEAKLRDAVKTTFQQFKTDIRAVHMKVKAARDAVVKVARELGKSGSQSKKVSPTFTESQSTEVSVGSEEKVNADL